MTSILPEKLDCFPSFPKSSLLLVVLMLSSNSIWQLLRLNCVSTCITPALGVLPNLTELPEPDPAESRSELKNHGWSSVGVPGVVAWATPLCLVQTEDVVRGKLRNEDDLTLGLWTGSWTTGTCRFRLRLRDRVVVDNLSKVPRSFCVDSVTDDRHNSGLRLLFGLSWDGEYEHMLLELFGLSSLKSLGMVSESDCRAFGLVRRCWLDE